MEHDFPTYKCTLCHCPLREANEAYSLIGVKRKEKHAWACERCVQELGLIW